MKISSWIALALLAAALASTQDLSKISSLLPSPSPSTPVVEPSAEMQNIVAPLRGRVKEPNDARRLSAFYRDFADVVRRDTGVLVSMVQFRQAHRSAVMAAFQTTDLASDTMPEINTFGVDMFGDFHNIGGDVDRAVSTAVTGSPEFQPVAIDAAKRTRLADVLAAIAWALEN